MCLLYYYICNMKKSNIKIEQQPISLGEENSKNYLIIVETLNGEPLNTYLVLMDNFQFYDETMPFYVINRN
jgi:hypothetical protein